MNELINLWFEDDHGKRRICLYEVEDYSKLTRAERTFKFKIGGVRIVKIRVGL